MVNVKKSKYATLARDNFCTFTPFVLESYGGMTPDCILFATQLATFADQHTRPHSWREVSRELMEGISVAIQRGNGMAALACLSMVA